MFVGWGSLLKKYRCRVKVFFLIIRVSPMANSYSPAPERILRAIVKNIKEKTVRENLWGERQYSNRGKDSLWMSWPWTPCDYLNHMERYLPEGMTLDDYGRGKGHWSIDHILPREFWTKYFGPKLTYNSDEHWMRDSLMDLRPLPATENSKDWDRETRMLPPDENPYFLELKHRYDALFDYHPYERNYRSPEETLLLYAPITVSDWHLRRPETPMFFECPSVEAYDEYEYWCDDTPDVEDITDLELYQLGLANYLNYSRMKKQINWI